MVISDFVLNFAFGLLAPIFAVFILKNINGGSIKVIGIATACYWIARTLTTVPLSRLMDRTDGERDEFYFSIIGTFVISSLPLFYLFSKEPWHIYLIQGIQGLANSMAVPAWRILFTDHIDRGRTGFEWSLEDIAIGVAVGASAYIGSIIADKFGFQIIFVMLSMLGYVATMLLVPLFSSAETLEQIKRQKKLEMLLRRRERPISFKIDDVK